MSSTSTVGSPVTQRAQVSGAKPINRLLPISAVLVTDPPPLRNSSIDHVKEQAASKGRTAKASCVPGCFPPRNERYSLRISALGTSIMSHHRVVTQNWVAGSRMREEPRTYEARSNAKYEAPERDWLASRFRASCLRVTSYVRDPAFTRAVAAARPARPPVGRLCCAMQEVGGAQTIRLEKQRKIHIRYG